MDFPDDHAALFADNDGIERYASACLRDHGLTGWTFAWDHAKRRLGSCRYQDKRITLSRHFVAHNRHRHDQIRDTILHEAAHALAWTHHGEKGHGPHWRAWCRELGAVPRASALPESVEATPCNYVLRLKDTGEIVGRYYRKPRFARQIKRVMLRGRPDTMGRLELLRWDDAS